MYCALQASKAFCDNKEDLLQLWVHETFRVVGDRMWDPADVSWLRKQVDERLSSSFSTNFATLFEDFNEQVRIGGFESPTGMGLTDTNNNLPCQCPSTPASTIMSCNQLHMQTILCP